MDFLPNISGYNSLLLKVLDSVRPWPLAARNKVEDSRIDSSVQTIIESEDEKLDEKLKSSAQSVSPCRKFIIRHLSDFLPLAAS
jgi:hypothetical protein